MLLGCPNFRGGGGVTLIRAMPRFKLLFFMCVLPEAEDVLGRTLVEVFSSITQGSLVECCFTIYTVTININKIYHG